MRAYRAKREANQLSARQSILPPAPGSSTGLLHSTGIPDNSRIVLTSPVLPRGIRHFLQIVYWPPAQQKLGLRIVQPVRMIPGGHRHRRQTARLCQIRGKFAIIHWLIHADVERLLMCLGMIDRPQYRRNQIFYMHKGALYRQALRIEHHWNSLRPEILIRLFGTNKIAPSWPAKHILAKRKLIPEIVFLDRKSVV